VGRRPPVARFLQSGLRRTYELRACRHAPPDARQLSGATGRRSAAPPGLAELREPVSPRVPTLGLRASRRARPATCRPESRTDRDRAAFCRGGGPDRRRWDGVDVRTSRSRMRSGKSRAAQPWAQVPAALMLEGRGPHAACGPQGWRTRLRRDGTSDSGWASVPGGGDHPLLATGPASPECERLAPAGRARDRERGLVTRTGMTADT
jgi:hypothetical protein